MDIRTALEAVLVALEKSEREPYGNTLADLWRIARENVVDPTTLAPDWRLWQSAIAPWEERRELDQMDSVQRMHYERDAKYGVSAREAARRRAIESQTPFDYKWPRNED